MVGGVHYSVMHCLSTRRSKAVQFKRMQNSNKQHKCVRLSVGSERILCALFVAAVRHVATLCAFV